MKVLWLTTFLWLALSSLQALTLNDGLVAHWNMDEASGNTILDLSGNGNDGALQNGASRAPGAFGGAVFFDGNNDFIHIANNNALNFNGATEMTVATWLNISGNGSGCCDPIVAQRDIGAWALRYDERDIGAEIEFIVRRNDGAFVGDTGSFGAPLPSLGEWHFIAGVLTGAEIQIYVDGVLVDSIGFGGSILNTSANETEIGGGVDGTLNGGVDEVRIYNRALSAGEIQTLAQGPPATVIPEPGSLVLLLLGLCCGWLGKRRV